MVLAKVTLVEIIGPILAALLASSVFKKKPYCLWVRNAIQTGWYNTNPGGNSARRCRKAAKLFLDAGVISGDILIIAKGITPPKEG